MVYKVSHQEQKGANVHSHDSFIHIAGHVRWKLGRDR